jgi:hypothetical protein
MLDQFTKRVLVCGGRDYKDRDCVFRTLDILHRTGAGISCIIAGGARGADTFAEQWADERGVPKAIYHAEWVKYGRRAGHLRNQRMMDEGKPDMTLAFPGGVGTADMVHITKKAGIELAEVWL